jgi:hypothetical protein
MKNTLLLLAKALLWFLLVMLLRPLNFLLDSSLAAYVRVREKCEDIQQPQVITKVIAIVFVILALFILTLYIYGKFV